MSLHGPSLWADGSVTLRRPVKWICAAPIGAPSHSFSPWWSQGKWNSSLPPVGVWYRGTSGSHKSPNCSPRGPDPQAGVCDNNVCLLIPLWKTGSGSALIVHTADQIKSCSVNRFNYWRTLTRTPQNVVTRSFSLSNLLMWAMSCFLIVGGGLKSQHWPGVGLLSVLLQESPQRTKITMNGLLDATWARTCGLRIMRPGHWPLSYHNLKSQHWVMCQKILYIWRNCYSLDFLR